MDLDWLAHFDVISRVTGVISSARWRVQRRRKHHRKSKQARGVAEVQFTTAGAGADVERMLKGYGVPVTDRRLVKKVKPESGEGPVMRTFAVKVPASERAWAQYLLAKIEAGGEGLPPAWADQKGEAWGSGKMSWGKSRRHSGTRTSGGRSSKSSRSSALRSILRKKW